MMAHRSPTKPRFVERPSELVASGPNELWSWDITYLPAFVRGTFYYLHLFVDVWSGRIMKGVVHTDENMEHSALALAKAHVEHGVTPHALALHADNAGPPNGATLLATMQSLGVVPSFSGSSVSNDNPFSEALFRTVEYAPSCPHKPFDSVDAARAWVERLVDWLQPRAPAQRHRIRHAERAHFVTDGAVRP